MDFDGNQVYGVVRCLTVVPGLQLQQMMDCWFIVGILMSTKRHFFLPDRMLSLFHALNSRKTTFTYLLLSIASLRFGITHLTTSVKVQKLAKN